MKPNAQSTTHSTAIPTDKEVRMAREAAIAVKQGWADEVRIYKGSKGRLCTREIVFSNTRVA